MRRKRCVIDHHRMKVLQKPVVVITGGIEPGPHALDKEESMRGRRNGDVIH